MKQKKTTKKRNIKCLPFLNCLSAHLQDSKKPQQNPSSFGFRLIATDWLKKGSGFKTQSSKS